MTRAVRLTTPDLVVLSLLSERPYHGYELYQVLLLRDVHYWAAVSRPQVYYSLRKLERLGMTRTVDGGAPEGPEKRTYEPTRKGRREASRALSRPDWATHRPLPPFLTWAALSWGTDEKAVTRQIDRRRTFLTQQIAREELTIASIREEFANRPSVPELMLELGLRAFQLELAWLDRLEPVALATLDITTHLAATDSARGGAQV